jgi:hypothetical protein
VLLTRAERVSIENGAESVSFHADGESLEHDGPLEVRLHRGALNLVMPDRGP